MSFRPFDLLNLVRDFGSDVILRKTSTSGTYNPATGVVDGSATTDHTVSTYFFNFSLGSTYEIVSVQTFYSDGVAICYICEVRD